jgi:hypothetical protein
MPRRPPGAGEGFELIESEQCGWWIDRHEQKVTEAGNAGVPAGLSPATCRRGRRRSPPLRPGLPGST